MSVWRARELPLEPVAGVLVQLSSLVGGPGPACEHTPFTECLQQLQALHDQQVAVLAGEVSRLRKEVESLRKEAMAADLGMHCQKVCVLAKEAKALDFVANCDYGDPPKSSPRPSRRTAALRKHTRKTTLSPFSRVADVFEQEDMTGGGAKRARSKSPTEERQPSKDTEFKSERSKDTSTKSLSCEVARHVTRHVERIKTGSRPTLPAVKSFTDLPQFKSEQSLDMVRTGSMQLLDDYTTYRATLTQGDRTSWSVKRLVSSPKFDVVMGTIIVANAVTIGLDASLNRAGHEVPLALQVSEYVFLLVYTVEICLRLAALRCRAMCNAWVQFDFLLVCCGFLDLATTYFGTSFKILDNVMLVRTFRLARLARVLRLMIKFRTLWMLVHGLLNSLMTLTWTCIIICILLFVFAVLGLELLQPDPSASQEYNLVASENFGSLLQAITTLLQGLTLDSFGHIYRPVMLEKPLSVFYFVPFLLVVSIALMNLVTALMVNFSLEQATKDRQAEEQMQQKQKEEVIRILEAAFAELDTDHSGQIDLSEMLAAPAELRTLVCQVADMGDGGGDADLRSIFRMLDFDNSGQLKIEDFCQGLMMLHDHKALESYFVMKHFGNIMKTMRPRRESRDSRDSNGNAKSFAAEAANTEASSPSRPRTEDSLPSWR